MLPCKNIPTPKRTATLAIDNNVPGAASIITKSSVPDMVREFALE
jgi:hypothetical protein